MKILQVPGSFLPAIGGVENHIYQLSREFIKRSHQVQVITSYLGSEKSPRVENFEGLSVNRLKYVFRVGGTPIMPALPLEMLKTEADIVHVHLPTPYSADIASLISRLRHIPCVLTYHNDIVGKGILNPVANFYNITALRLLLSNVDSVIIQQQRYLEFSTHLKKFNGKIKLIPPGVDINVFKPFDIKKEENKNIFFLSILDEMHRYKGLDYLLKALVQVRKEIPNVRLIVGGTGALVSYYEEMAESLGLGSSVEFHGFIPESKLVEYYNNSNVFVLPSILSAQEGYGLVALEALACGVPIVVTDIVGIAEEMLTNNVGFTVPPKNVEGLADALIRILRDLDMGREMGRNGRKLIEEKYTWARVADQVLQLYQSLL